MWSPVERYTATFNSLHKGFVTLILVALAVTPVDSAAQNLPRTPSDSTRVSLLTILPSEPIYAAFAHSAFRFNDPVNDVDIVFNYGTFDFNAPGFVPRFVNGDLDYFLSVLRTRDQMEGWEMDNRSVIEQTLRMSRENLATLWTRLLRNALPENKYYRYDFLAENCSTILLDFLQETEGSALRFDSTRTESSTFRELLQPYLEHRPFWDLGIDLVLGSRIDRKSTYLERSFLPVELMRIVDQATLMTSEPMDSSGAGGDLHELPYVIRTDTLEWRGRGYDPEAAFPWLPIIIWLAALGWFLLDLRQPFDRIRSTWPDRLLFGLLGVVGIVLLYMWIGTAHYVTADNWNLVWALPLHIVPAFAWNLMGKRVLRKYFAITAALSVALILAQFVLPQTLHPAFLPIVAVIVWRSWLLARKESKTEQPFEYANWNQ